MEDEDKILEIKSRDVELKELSRISWSAENKSTVGVSLPFSKSHVLSVSPISAP